MEPRDLFDVLLVAILGAAAYADLFGSPFSLWRLRAVVDTVLGLDVTVYLVVAGILGVAYVGYIAVYLPRKQSTEAR